MATGILTGWLLVGLMARPPLIAAPDEAGWQQHVERVELEARRFPDSPGPALRLAAGYAKRRRATEALRWADEAARRGAHKLQLGLIRGDAYFFANQFEQAIVEYFEVAQQSGSNAYALSQLWQCLRAVPVEELARAVDLTQAKVLLRSAGYYVPDAFIWPPEPETAVTLTQQATESLKAGDFKAALVGYEDAVAHDGTHAPAFRGMALALTRLNKRRQAFGAWHLFSLLHTLSDRDARKVRRLLLDEERRRGVARRPRRSRSAR